MIYYKKSNIYFISENIGEVSNEYNKKTRNWNSYCISNSWIGNGRGKNNETI